MAGSSTAGRRPDVRLIVLVTSPRVAPGLLSLRAWDALRAASKILAGSPDHPQLVALDQAGLPWELAPGEPSGARASRLIALAGPGAGGWLAAPAGGARPPGALAAGRRAGGRGAHRPAGRSPPA